MNEDKNGIVNEEPKRTLKDSLFKGFFATNKKAFIDLYREASGGKELKEEDITPYSLNSDIVSRSLYNDVSYITKDNKLIILVEHQSTVNKNMAEREFLYYAAIVYQYIIENKIELSSKKDIKLPLPEFYVLYNGKAKYDTDSLQFGNDFLQVNVKLLDAKLEQLLKNKSTNVDKKDYLIGYSYLINEVERIRKENKNMDSKEVFATAVSNTLKAGYGVGIIDKPEFSVSYGNIFSREEELMHIGREEGIEEGLEKGIEQKNIDLVCQMTADGFSMEQISKYTKRSVEWVTEVSNNYRQGIEQGIEETIKKTMKLLGVDKVKKIGVAKFSETYGLSEEVLYDLFKEVEGELNLVKNNPDTPSR